MDILTNIANDYLNVETLEQRRSDSLDFHEVYCENILGAMIEAYETGKNTKSTKKEQEELELYGRTRLGRETLYMRKRDSLDFFEVSVWGIKEVLEYSYEKGMRYHKLT